MLFKKSFFLVNKLYTILGIGYLGMKGSDLRVTVSENGNINNNNEEIEWEVTPGGMLVQKRNDDNNQDDDQNNDSGVFGGSAIKIKVSHGSNQHYLTVPSHSTFGELKIIIAQETGLEPQEQRLLFRGKEKDDHEYLYMAGVKDNSKVLVMKESTSKERMPEEQKPEEVKGSGELSKGDAAVAEVRAQVDKLSEQVSALEVVVYGGTKVEEKDIVYLTEMLMRQLLKLDGIEAEGEGKVQRKMEVLRIQSYVEKVDKLKARNSNTFNSSSNSVSVTNQWETFESGVGSLHAPPPMPSATEVTRDWEHFD